MVATNGGNVNKNTEAVLSAEISVGSGTSVTILAAQVTGDAERIEVIITNNDNKDCWIKYQAASVDNDKKGFLVAKKSVVTIMDGQDIYTGEISAIADSGTTKIFVTSF